LIRLSDTDNSPFWQPSNAYICYLKYIVITELSNWTVFIFNGNFPEVLRGILSLPNHIIKKIATAHVTCSNQWCGVRCSCSPSKMIAHGWHKLKCCKQMEWFTVAIDGRLFHSYGNAVLTLVMHWGQKIHLW
jgi:hypothetical protein